MADSQKSFQRLIDGQINFPGTDVKLSVHLDLTSNGEFMWCMEQPGNGGGVHVLPVHNVIAYAGLRDALAHIRLFYPTFKVTGSVLEGIPVDQEIHNIDIVDAETKVLERYTSDAKPTN